MANRILLGDIGSTFGLKVSRAGTDVTTGADKDMLFDSTKNRTGQIYGGGAGITFVTDATDQEVYVRGTANMHASPFTGQPNGGYTGKKIIIDGTTVTLSTTSTYFNYTYTTVENVVTDINNASIANITAAVSNLGGSDKRLRLVKTNSDMVITYPASNSLETIVGIPGATYDYPELASSGVNFLTGGASTKPNLGYIPLVLLSEQHAGGYEGEYDDEETFYESVNRLNLWKTTSSTIHPVAAGATLPSTASTPGTDIGAPVSTGRYYEYSDANEDNPTETEMVNASFFVIRIPCAYGYMTTTYFGT